MNPYEKEILYMGAKEHAFTQEGADPFQAALEWLLARDWAALTQSEAEKVAAKVAQRVARASKLDRISHIR